MKSQLIKRISLLVAGTALLTAMAAPQLKQAIKIIGVGAAVQKFGGEMNKAINKLANHKDTEAQFTRVVPILTVGIGKSSAIGAAQVTGRRSDVEKVKAVAAPETELFGKEIRIRALIPISTDKINGSLQKVEGVGISGIVDLKL
jgi:hypothetical protein